MRSEQLFLAAGMIMTLGYIPYIIAILRGLSKPSKTSWMVWVVLDGITLASMLKTGAFSGQMVGSLVGGWIVLALSFKYGQSGWTKTDVWCLRIASVGVALWILLQNPVLATISCQFAAFVACIPTFAILRNDPNGESRWGWTIWMTSCIVAVVAMPRITWADSTQPLNFLLYHSVIMYLIYVRPLVVVQQNN